MSELNLTNLQKAVLSLDTSIAVLRRKQQVATPDDEMDVLRAGVIQNFEFTYEIAWKAIRRWLMVNISPSVVESITRRELYILAADNGLIDYEKVWMGFNVARNSTSHNYDDAAAADVLVSALSFNDEVKKLLENLEK